MKAKAVYPVLLHFMIVLMLFGNLVAQESRINTKLFLSAGLGYNTIKKHNEWTVKPTSNDLNTYGRVGYGFSKHVQLMLELAFTGKNGEAACSDLSPDGSLMIQEPHTFKNDYLLLSLQYITNPGIYFRAGIGFASHSYASYYISERTCLEGNIGTEAGPAIGLATGFEYRMGKYLAPAIEGYWLTSGGEDSTGSMSLVGFRFVVSVYF